MIENEALRNAKAELKRADHLIFVSLKYTRTVDVIKNIVKRLITTFDFGFQAILEQEYREGNIKQIPKLPRQVIDEVVKLHQDNENIKNIIIFYRLLKKIDKAEFDARQEYRRHVTMTAHMQDGSDVEVSIDIISDYYQRAKEFISYVEKLIKGEIDEEKP